LLRSSILKAELELDVADTFLTYLNKRRKLMNKWFLGVLFGLSLPLSIYAAPVTVSYSATVGFDPSATVAVGGQNAATLINELFGPGIGSAGTATLTGTFTYESTTPALNSNSRSAGYINAITGASVSIGASTVTADVHNIAANAATSTLGYNTNPSPSLWCNTPLDCSLNGLSFTPSGNLVQMNNDTDFVLQQNGNQVNYFDRDAISLAIGYTHGSNFLPLLSTPTFGDVNVKSLTLVLISDANKSLNDSMLLPNSASFVTSSEVESSLFTVDFVGIGLTGGFTLNGQLTNFTTSPLPEPETYAMLLAGLGVVSFLGRQKRRSRSERAGLAK
jgi:hypothetical protein